MCADGLICMSQLPVTEVTLTVNDKAGDSRRDLATPLNTHRLRSFEGALGPKQSYTISFSTNNINCAHKQDSIIECLAWVSQLLSGSQLL